MAECKKCKKDVAGGYNTPIGFFCCDCYDKGMKKKVSDYYLKQQPIVSVLGYQFPDVKKRTETPKTFTFVKVKLKDSKQESSDWNLLAKSEEEVKFHFENYIGPEIRKGVKDYIDVESGLKHATTAFSSAISQKIKFDQTNKSANTIATELENKTLLDRLDLIKQGKALLLSMGLQYSTVHEDLIVTDKIIKESFLYPSEDMPTEKDIIIKSWKGGQHYYSKIGKLDVVDSKGNVKWNTFKEAWEESLKYLKELQNN